MLPEIFIDEETINSLKITIERERNVLEAQKKILSELEQKEEYRRIQKMEVLLSALYKKRARQNARLQSDAQSIPIVHQQELSAIDQFLIMEKQPAIEALNFLLTDFFTCSFPTKKWDNVFISELVFEVTRVINLISAIKKD